MQAGGQGARRTLAFALAALLGAASSVLAATAAHSQEPPPGLPGVPPVGAPSVPPEQPPLPSTPTVTVPELPETPPADLPLAIGLRKTVDTIALTPTLELDFSVDKQSAIPSDTLTYTATATNAGAELASGGLTQSRNCTGKTARIRSWFDFIEFREDSTSKWTPLAGIAASEPGYEPREVPPIDEGLTLTALPVAAEGVAYPEQGDPILGARYASHATAAWDYVASAQLSSEQVDLLLANKKLQIRNVFHAEAHAPTGLPDEIHVATDKTPFTEALHTQSGDIRDGEIEITDPEAQASRFDKQTTPGLARIGPGEAVSVTDTHEVPVPAAKGGSEPDPDYLERLSGEDNRLFAATAKAKATAAGSATQTETPPPDPLDDLASELAEDPNLACAQAVAGKLGADEPTEVAQGPERPIASQKPDPAAQTTRHLPILALQKSGPEAVNAGTTANYDFALHNSGSANARLELSERVAEGPERPVAGLPDPLGAAERAVGHASFQIPAAAEPGPLEDTATLGWRDLNGNAYGPITDRFTTEIVAADTPSAPPLSKTQASPFIDHIAFIFTGENPLQTGVAVGAIPATRPAALRTRLTDRAGAPLAGVKVTVPGHPEFGQTESQQDGAVYIATAGGRTLRFRFEKDGYLPAERAVQMPIGDWAHADDVALTEREPTATTIDLSAASPPLQVARGVQNADAAGARQPTLIFQEDTKAELVSATGDTQAADTLTLRVGEYSVGATGQTALPATLPRAAGYSFAADFSADEAVALGAQEVRLTKPAVSYLENFLSFPVGQAIPSGAYDPTKGAWVPQPNGRVVKILSTDGGIATLDIDGSGQAASASALAALGVTDAERTKLAELYPAGTQLWRVALAHLSAWSYAWPYAPSAGATAPKAKLAPRAPDACCGGDASLPDYERQVLIHDFAIAGTPFSLSYRSDSVRGAKGEYSAKLRLTESTLPPGLKRIDLAFEIAGKRIADSLTPAPDQSYDFAWDGRDAFGRVLQGAHPLTATIGFVYDGAYQAPAAGDPAFGRVSGSGTSADPYRSEVVLSQQIKTTLGVWDERAASGLGGWRLSVHQAYDPGARKLQLGDDEPRSDEELLAGLHTFAGSPLQVGFGGDGGPATKAEISRPTGLALGPDGTLYIADYYNERVRRVDAAGIITTVAGNGQFGFSGDGGPATQARFARPEDVAVDPADGTLYIVDSLNNRVRKVSPEGIITTFAGGGPLNPQGYPAGDGGPATEASLLEPRGVAVDPADGTVYIIGGSSATGRLRAVSPGGIISTVAGAGQAEEGPASGVYLSTPYDVDVAPDGSLVLVHSSFLSCCRYVLRISPDGIAKRIGGENLTSGCGPAGDGGPARDAGLCGVFRVKADSQGGVYLAEHGRHRIRYIDSDGIIDTVAGGVADLNDPQSPEESPPIGFKMAPYGLEIAESEDGTELVIGDRHRPRVYAEGPYLPAFTGEEIVLPPEDGSEIYRFDANGRHLKTLNPLTGTDLYRFAYDDGGRLISVTDGDGNATTIERDAFGRATAIVAPFGQRTALGLESRGYLARITDPEGGSRRFNYSDKGLVGTYTDPRGGAYRYTYDSLGRLSKSEDPASGSEALTRQNATERSYEVAIDTAAGRHSTYKLERQAAGDLRRILTDPAGNVSETLLGKDASQRFTAPDGTVTTDSLGPDSRFGMKEPQPKTKTTKTPSGLTLTETTTRTQAFENPDDRLSPLTSRTDTLVRNGKSWKRDFLASTRRFTDTSPAGRITKTDVDAQERPVREERTDVAPTTYSYDARGRLIQQAQGARVTAYAYGADGLLSQITDPLNRVTSFAYDQAGRLTRKTLPDGSEVAYAYDAQGNLTSVTPPARPAHVFSFSPVDLRAEYSPPDLDGSERATRYTYNPDRQVELVTTPDGRTIDYDYDSAGRLSSVTDSAGARTYTYSQSTGNLASISAPGGQTLAFEYDGALPTKQTYSGPVAGSVSQTHDSDLRLASDSVNGSSTATYAYDADGLITKAGDLTINRRASNGLIQTTALGNVTTTHTRDSFGDEQTVLAQHGSTDLLKLDYTRDDLGRITTKQETDPDGVTTWGYEYDAAGRLVRVRKDGELHSEFTYDQNSNRTKERKPDGSEVTADYDTQDRLTRYGATDYSYRRNGELQTKTEENGDETTYDYDEVGGLRKATLPDGTEITYVLDGRGQRVGKKVNGTLTQAFLYDQRGLLPIAELDGDGNIVARFVYGTSQVAPDHLGRPGIAATVSGDPSVNLAPDYSPQPTTPDYLLKDGREYRIVTDQVGSVRLVVDSADGTIAQRLDYDAFGEVTRDTAPGFQLFGFAGGLYDRDTGLLRFGARDYDPGTGRWTAKDPIDFFGGDANLYRYGLSDPVNLSDPSGLWPSLGSTFRKLRKFAKGVAKGAKRKAKKVGNFISDCASRAWHNRRGCLADEYERFRRSTVGRAIKRILCEGGVIPSDDCLIGDPSDKPRRPPRLPLPRPR